MQEILVMWWVSGRWLQSAGVSRILQDAGDLVGLGEVENRLHDI